MEAGERQAGGARVLGRARHVGRGALDPGGVGRRGGRDGRRRRPGARTPTRRTGRRSASARSPPARSRRIVVDARAEYAQRVRRPGDQGERARTRASTRSCRRSRGPVIARHLVAAAREHGADAVAHGCTGKGNDQVRFEVSVRALAPDLDVLAPVRVWGFTRHDSIEYAARHDIPITVTEEKPYSIDENIVGRAIECGILEDPWVAPPEDVYEITRSVARRAARAASRSCCGSTAACPIALDGAVLPLHEILERAEPDRRGVRVRPARHGREPPGRHQEPRDLRVPGDARADARPRRPRVDHARARRRCGRSRASSRATRSSSTTGCGSRRCARRSTRSSTRRSAT